VDAGKLTVPAAPPPAPRIQGADVPAVTAPTPHPVAPPAPPPAPRPVTTARLVTVPFQPGSAGLAAESQDALRALALRRGAAALEAIGYGDANAGDLTGQSAALPLALSRARAIAAVLTASGVPAAQVRLMAEAEGSGGAARLAD
jgi:outer membrane protein OmpA-like peptidoglycan-associated protein